MAGQGNRVVRECINRFGWSFRAHPKMDMRIAWCRHCGYQVKLHEDVVKLDSVRPGGKERGDG